MKNALVRNRIFDKLYDPPYIPFSYKESIEDFIYKLNFIKKDNEIFQANLADMELEDKINLARGLVLKYIQNNELIFLVDEWRDYTTKYANSALVYFNTTWGRVFQPSINLCRF